MIELCDDYIAIRFRDIVGDYEPVARCEVHMNIVCKMTGRGPEMPARYCADRPKLDDCNVTGVLAKPNPALLAPVLQKAKACEFID